MNLNDRRKALTAQIDSLRSTEGWKTWLRVRRHFHRYSLHNQLLIATQNPRATRVAGYVAWKKLGYQVARGQKAIQIWAPMRFKPKNPEDDPGIRFKIANVFDVTQTLPTDKAVPLTPPGNHNIDGDDLKEAYDRLKLEAIQDGIKVRVEGDQAYYSKTKNLIALPEGKSYNQLCSLLAHELAHSAGWDYQKYSRQEAEVMAETAAWLTCDALGLPTDDSAVPYIAGWADDAEEVLLARASEIDKVAKWLITAAEAPESLDQPSGAAD